MLKQICVIAVLLLPNIIYASQACTASIPATTPTNQFVDNHDGTVTHLKTNLMWKKCSEGQIWNNSKNTCDGILSTYESWKLALDQAQAVNNGGGFAGQVDWRVPNIKELRSIIERQCYFPAINLAIFPNTSDWDFWSSSPLLNNMLSVSFFSGHENSHLWGTYVGLRLVRGGQ